MNNVAILDTHSQASPHYTGKILADCDTCGKECDTKFLNEFNDCWDCEQHYIRVGQKVSRHGEKYKIKEIRFLPMHSIFDNNDEFVKVKRVAKDKIDNIILMLESGELVWADVFKEFEIL